MTAPTPDALRAAFAAGAEWMRDVAVLRDGDIQAEASRRHPDPIPRPCPVCGRDDISVIRRGVMRSHNNKLGYWCRGTGQPPAAPKGTQ